MKALRTFFQYVNNNECVGDILSLINAHIWVMLGINTVAILILKAAQRIDWQCILDTNTLF